MKFLYKLGAPVAVIPSTGSGRHNIPNKQVGQLPGSCVLAMAFSTTGLSTMHYFKKTGGQLYMHMFNDTRIIHQM